MVEPSEALGWSFTAGAIAFGVFGFLFSTYAAASFRATAERPIRPEIAKDLRGFCWVLALVLSVVTLSAVLGVVAGWAQMANWARLVTAVLVVSFVTMSVSSLLLARRMH